KTSNLICRVFESNEKWKEKITEIDGIKKYSTGNETIKEKKIQEKIIGETSFEQPQIIALKKYNLNPWQNKLVLAVNKNKISVDDDENITAKSDFGILMHHILSKIILATDSQMVLYEFQSSKIILPQQKKEIEKIIEDVLRICEPYKWFSKEWTIKTEAPMLLPDGTVIRPDRIMIKENKTVLLDYKTGEEDSLHEKQLLSYEQNLIAAGYESVEKYLLYLKPIKLVKL
ncbi:MAG: hypothetical protein ABI855_10595, partial [Bacteroidota bacterium]